MTNINQSHVDNGSVSLAKFSLPIFSAALFLSAFLIFAIQPMFAKMVLPLLGGAPAVWNTAMVFFQASLLGGYLYAHLLASKVPFEWQAAVHLGVLTLGAFSLPFAVDAAFLPQPGGLLGPAILVLFAVSIGFPFFALSANAPLLQSWFARSGHKLAKDPYFLYGASNIGSVLALLSYPIVIEPLLPIKTQTIAWASGYVLLALTILAAARSARHAREIGGSAGEVTSQTTVSSGTGAAISVTSLWGQRLRWMAAAAIPSSLMLGATTNITTNVASAPFLWVLPLALYLGTFILVFDRKSALPMRWIGIFHTFFLISVLVFSFVLRLNIVLAIGSHLALFFLSALICHADLASRRPAAERLTEFYLCMSAGGVIGGGLTALFAPILFSSVFEYPLMLAAACLFLPGSIGKTRESLVDMGYGIALFMIALLIAVIGNKIGGDVSDKMPFGIALFILSIGAYCGARNRPLRAAATALTIAVAVHMFLPSLTTADETSIVSRERSFFGVSTVKATETELGLVHKFAHGDTVHNMQLRTAEHRREPLAYYSVEGPFGDAIRATRARKPNMSVAAIGLGAGALACYTEPGENWVFYEIDPAVIRMATDPSRFSYLSDCAPGVPIVLGDARLTLAKENDQRFDLVIVDAFSSDSIPAHLVTVEALAMYRRKLKPDGILFFHVSNRYADVGSVALAGANYLGLGSRFISFQPQVDVPLAPLKVPVIAVAVAREEVLAQAFDGVSTWQPMLPNASVSAWRDDWSNIVGALVAKFYGGPLDVQQQSIAVAEN